MAFMMPVVKSNYDIYQQHSGSGGSGSPANGSAFSSSVSRSSRSNSRPRSRKTSQSSYRSRSQAASIAISPPSAVSLSSSPESDFDEKLRALVAAAAAAGGNNDGFHSTNSSMATSRLRRISRCSEHGTAATATPNTGGGGARGSLFRTGVVSPGGRSSRGARGGCHSSVDPADAPNGVVPQSASVSSLNKFHMRLIERLRRAFSTKDDSSIRTSTVSDNSST